MGPKQSKDDDVIDGDPNVLGPHMFKMGRVLGKGAFGKVLAVTKKDTKKTYAVKLLNKIRVLEKQSYKSVLTERKLLAFIDCPFVVNLRAAYQTETDLCMVVDLMSGGDVRFHLSKEYFFDEERVKFYAASCVLGLEYLHSRRICHRDIKPDNLLLDENGYCHLTDFNISVQYTDAKPNASNFAGTKPYMAPEVWQKQSYSLEPDWFSLGATLYEMVVGRVPFYIEPFIQDPDSALLKKAILEDKPHFPKRLTRECMSFLYSLLEKNPQKRLKLPAVKQHAWFKGYDWEKIANKTAKPPFEPNKTKANVMGIHDLEEQLGEKPKVRPLTDEEKRCFEDWNWVRENAFDDNKNLATQVGTSTTAGSSLQLLDNKKPPPTGPIQAVSMKINIAEESPKGSEVPVDLIEDDIKPVSPRASDLKQEVEATPVANIGGWVTNVATDRKGSGAKDKKEKKDKK